MGIHFNHKSKAGDRKMQKELKLKMKAEERKRKSICLKKNAKNKKNARRR